jgi:glycosyltransferase involved in cell wall biosynthesis
MRRIILFLSFVVSSLFAIPLIGEVHVVWAANPNVLSMIPAMVFGFLKRCLVAMNVDDLWPEDMYSLNLIQEKSITSKIAELLARIAYHKAKLITPISPGYINVISGKYGVKLDKIHVVRAGVDIQKFKPIYSKSESEGKFRVFYSGAFSVAYDFDQILMAAKLIGENDGGVEFIIQGGGELANHIKLMVKKLGPRNVRIMDEVVSRERVAELLNNADTLILPLRNFGRPYLGISSKLYEYQAVGKPIICCAEGQPAEYVKETRSGVVVKPGDYEALAKAVVYLKNNSNLARELGDSGRRYIEDNLSIEKIGKEMVTIFKSLSSLRSRP